MNKSLDCRSRDMLNFDFLEKGALYVLIFKKNVYLIIFYQVTKFHCLFVLRFWAIWVLQLFVSQIVM